MSPIQYAAVLEAQPEGGFTVAFPDLPEAITEGDDRDAALFNAREVLTLVLEQRMAEGEDIPSASPVKDGVLVEPSASVQASLLVRTSKGGAGQVSS